MASGESESDDATTMFRRRLLGAMGAVGIGGLAGCQGDSDTEDGTPTPGGGTPGTPGTPVDTGRIVEGGTLNVALTENPSSFDPPYSSGVPSTLVQNFFYESLVASDQQGNLYPWIAESYELLDTNSIEATAYTDYMTSVPIGEDERGNPVIDTTEQILIRDPDNNLQEDDEARILTRDGAADAVADGTYGMQFQYNIHEGVTFTTGEEVTSENVIRPYDRIENSQISAQVFNTFLHAEAVDDYTVNLYAQVPDAEAERLLPQYIHPSDNFDVPAGELDPRQGNDPIGTGPWQFESFEDSQSLVVSRRDDYWLEEVGLDAKSWWDGPEDFPASPVIDEVNMRIVPEDATRAGALQENEVDVTYGLTAESQNNFDNSDDYQTKSVETGGYLFMQYPVKVSPWDNQNVRRAANHLIPRQQIVDNIELGWARPAYTPLPELAYGSGTEDPEALEEDLQPMNEYNPGRAEELINEAGVETPIEVQIETNSDNQDRVRKVEVIAESMNNTGLFDVNVETFEFGDFVGRILSPDYFEKGNILVVGLSGTFNPGSFCTATHHSRNWGQCCNSQKIEFDDLDQMMDDARFSADVLGDAEERGRRYDEIWHRIVELSGNSYIDIDLTTAVHNNEVNGFESYPFPEGMFSYALHAPYDEQITYIDRE